MLIKPILPIYLMGIICVVLLLLKRKKKSAYIRQIFIVLLLFVINLRCMLPGDTIEVEEQKLDTYVLFVVDSTISMVAQDYDGNHPRLDGVRRDCARIMQELPGAHFSVISFNNTATQLSPYTDNTEHIQNVLDSIMPIESLYARGTSFQVAQETMKKSLMEAAEKTTGKLAVFFISDGEMIGEDASLEGFGELKALVENGAVLGYGTKQGGQMQVKNYYDEEVTTIMDYDTYPEEPAISKIEEQNLKRIAKDLGLSYIHMSDDPKLDEIIAKIKKEANVTRENSIVTTSADPYMGAKDLYFVFVIPLVVLLMYEAIFLVKEKAYGG